MVSLNCLIYDHNEMLWRKSNYCIHWSICTPYQKHLAEKCPPMDISLYSERFVHLNIIFSHLTILKVTVKNWKENYTLQSYRKLIFHAKYNSSCTMHAPSYFKTKCSPQGEPYPLTNTIEIWPTPGHTGSDISVIVRNSAKGVIVIAGMRNNGWPWRNWQLL